jgi:hypothetical protein
MEKHHEDVYRCSRVGYADCRADVRSVRKCRARIPGEFLVRQQRLLRAVKLDQQRASFLIGLTT